MLWLIRCVRGSEQNEIEIEIDDASFVRCLAATHTRAHLGLIVINASSDGGLVSSIFVATTATRMRGALGSVGTQRERARWW